MSTDEYAKIVRDSLQRERFYPDGPTMFSLNTLVDNLKRAEAALAEIEAKPYRAEEVTARYRRETL